MIKAGQAWFRKDTMKITISGDSHDIARQFRAVTAAVCDSLASSMREGKPVQEFVRKLAEDGMEIYETAREAAADGD